MVIFDKVPSPVEPVGTYIWVAEGMYYNSRSNVPGVWKGTVMIIR
jgi:hypothetical protein